MEFRVLGPVSAWRDGGEVPLDGAKQRTVLAVLLLARGRIVSDTRLCQLLWDEHPPATFAAQLYNYVSRLRKYLGDEVEIVRQWSGYMLRMGDSRLDLDEFERMAGSGRDALRSGRHEEAARELHGALALWRGATLANVTDHLVEAESPRMTEVRMAVLEDRITVDLMLGRQAELVVELSDLVAAQPLHEQLRSHLMTALLRCDRQADALAVYHEGRRVLADELGADPGPALAEAYQVVLAGRGMPDVAVAARAGAGWRDVRPAMLPPGAQDFCGREQELRELAGLLAETSPSAPQRTLLTGMPGVGKSALALRAAHLCRGEFPDGQLYADLGGTRGNATDPGDVLGWFLRSLGNAEEAIPRRLDERECLYRSQLAGRRVLVVLDNSANYPQVRPLLPGDPSCRVILTCRGRLSELPGVTRVEVGILDPAQALELFATIVGSRRVAAELGAAHRIVQLCGRLSIGIRVAAARLIARPHWSLRYLAQRLADERFRLNELRLGTLDVRARIEGSYQELEIESQVALRRLALLNTADFPIGAAARVLGVTPRVGEEVAESLVDARLLEIAGSDGGRRQRHRFHDLVRVFAREKADPVDHRVVTARSVLSA
ncbi:AfsR/SARP family transcriptional regulator [Micromonospora orduensis]|uniref:AfsR/SARP family transcriptional regulator n=1 Tax=Micromonospora orduensis TaxID=1420891 RepID=UPI00142E98F2|nr:AfsR/SARP family transcriptional regulator [Micromonospora orduensis]